MAAKRNAVIELFWKIHPKLYRWTGGRFGGRLMGLPVLLLRTKGRKTGQTRENALLYLSKNGSCVVIASYLGEPRHPDWYLNLKANPDAEVQIGDRTIPVRARDVEGDEREQLWNEAVSRMSDYAEYQKRTKRKIPVVVLDPRH